MDASVHDFEERVALVTGAGSGIGRAAALQFARRGASVAVADIDGPAAEEAADEIVAAGGDALAVVADVAEAAAVSGMLDATVTRFGRLDCAANIAGISPGPRPFTDHTLAEWQRVIDVNLTGVFLCMQAELRQLLAQGEGGAIVNMSSGAGVVAAPGLPQYTAAKHGVLGLTKQAAQEYARQGIRVNAVLPGQTDTPPMRRYLEAAGDAAQAMVRMLPMGRMATVDEVADAVVWLCSDAASYVSGTSLFVDGATLCR